MRGIKAGTLFVPSSFFDGEFDKVVSNLQNDSLSGAEKKTLLALSELTTSDGLCCASAPKIAVLTGLNDKTTNGATVSLARKEFVLVKRGRGVPNVYFFLWKDVYAKAFKGPVCGKEEIELRPIKRAPKNPGGKVSRVDDKTLGEVLIRIKEEYHPSRRNQQPATAKRELSTILNEAVNGSMEKEAQKAAIDAKASQIVDFIKQMRTLPIWTRNDGKFLMGLGNFLTARGWEVTVLAERESLQSQLSELIENEI